MKFNTLLLCLCISVKAFSKDFKFGKVSKEELQEQVNPQDSSANATYLYKYRRSHIEYRQNDGFSIITDVHQRIKIYTKEGFDYATQTINLHVSGNEEENVIGLKAYTYNLENGKVEDIKLDKGSVFETEQSKYLNQVKFTMPNIKEGCVIEFKYTISSPFYWNVEDFIFQHDIPVKNLYATFESPEYFNFKINQKGFLPIKPEHGKEHGTIQFTTKSREDGVRNRGTTFGRSELSFVINTTTINLDNVPALKEEPYVNNIDNYRSAIKYELSYTNFPQSPIKYYATTWEDVVKTIYDSSSFGKELEKTGYFEDDINTLVADVSNPIERASIIYDYVKSHVKWNNYAGKYVDKGVKRAYLTKTGNVAEINLMLTAMLRHVGLNANPVLISTRKNGIPLFPTIDGYNYVISAIETPEGYILLDATNQYGLPNVLPVRVLNWEGRIIRKNKTSTTVNLYPSQKSKKIVSVMANLSEAGELIGSLRSVKSDHLAMRFRKQYLQTDNNQYLEELENKYGGIEINDFEVKNIKELSKPVQESYKFSLENQADIIDDKIYFSPLFFLRVKENPFKLEKREFPIDFSYPSNSKYQIVIYLPEGYKVESVPEPLALALPEKLGAFSYRIDVVDSKILIALNTEINTAIVSPIYYEALKAYFSRLIEKESEQIVLTKV